MAASRREKYLLSAGIVQLLDERYDTLSQPGDVVQLEVTNLRNRPLSTTSVDSMRESILSLYHNLITGSKDFPVIPFIGRFRSYRLVTPFINMEQQEEQRENICPSSLMARPPGLMRPAPGTVSFHQIILTTVLPEKTELGAVTSDRRNRVRRLEVDGKTVTRVISPVYRPDMTEVTNRWRLSDYGEDGQVLMSVLCQFTPISVRCARPPQRKRKRSDTDTGSKGSSLSKRMRV
uniref:uncharacterized protein LOC124067624 n=1 Tax=Scatophagus argus TaxID=75038 RepID=UPI001ED835B6|nr:uncharacterized protein LOC124067624 [Scatophagus argus]